MTAVWRKGILLGVVAAAACTIGCSGGDKLRKLELENEALARNADELRRRNEALEKENAMLRGDDKLRDAYIKKLEQENELQKKMIESLKGIPGTEIAEGGILRLAGDFFFRPGSDDLSKEGIDSLRMVAEKIKAQDVYVRIVGHTDDDPINRSKKENPTGMNLELGSRRAIAVAQQLKKDGIEETRMHVVSMGEAAPIAGNDSKDGKKKNRRVDIMLLSSPPTGVSPDRLEEKAPAPPPRRTRREEPSK